MAERRMFAKTIIDSDAFLDLIASEDKVLFHFILILDELIIAAHTVEERNDCICNAVFNRDIIGCNRITSLLRQKPFPKHSRWVKAIGEIRHYFDHEAGFTYTCIPLDKGHFAKCYVGSP